jgi:hypothetical protein
MNKLLNYSELSKRMTGKPNIIRSNQVPKKYLAKVEMLERILNLFEKEEL